MLFFVIKKGHYFECNKDLAKICPKNANGVQIRRKCGWYKTGKTSTYSFLNFEKYKIF